MLQCVCEKTRDDAIVPTKANRTDIGWDIYLPKNSPSVMLEPDEKYLFETNIIMQIPCGFAFILKEKSGLAVKKSVEIKAGVIDEGYRDSIKVLVKNAGSKRITFNGGDKLCQGIFVRNYEIEMLEGHVQKNTERGTNGFGSTGQ